MNNGRPNQGNPGAWGQQANQGGQPMPYRTNPGMQGGAQQPYQPQQPYPQGYAPRGGVQQGGQPNQPNQQPYQQGFRQPVYQRMPQGNGAYQQPQQPPQGMQQPMQHTQYQHTQYQNTQYQQPYQNTQYRQPYPGQPYPGYPQPYPGQQPQQPPKSQKKPFDLAIILWVMLCGVLPVLFVLGFVLSDLAVLKWVFVGAAVITLACLWIKPLISQNARLTFSGVYGALAVVALVSALTSAVPMDSTNDPQNTNQGGSNQLSGQLFQQDSGSDSLGEWYTEEPVTTKTPEPDGLQSAAVEQMKSFFYFWSVNNQENMISLCAPSWRQSVSDPKVKLFSILANRTPVEYEAEKITGTENDSTRTITVTALINKNNGKDPEKYRFQVIMRKEDGQWYVDPASLESHETVTTAAPTANDTATPTAEFIASANTVLYYNADGGQRYHLDAYCKTANEKFLPFKGQFYYSQLNEDAYKDLVACNVCGAPLRQ